MPCLALVLESGVTNMTLKRTISGMIGTGSLAHNRREFIAENVDSDRVQLNICYQNENLKEVYKEDTMHMQYMGNVPLTLPQ